MKIITTGEGKSWLETVVSLKQKNSEEAIYVTPKVASYEGYSYKNKFRKVDPLVNKEVWSMSKS